MTLNLHFFLVLIALIWPTVSWSVATCSKNFEQISNRCIASTNLKFSGKPIPLSTELKDDIFFFKTANKEIGKLKVLGVVANKKQCSFSFEAVTYNGDSVFIPNSSLKIGVDKENWLFERIYLDKEGTSAIELVKRRPIFLDESGGFIDKKGFPVDKEGFPINEKGEPDPSRVPEPKLCQLILTKGVEFGKYHNVNSEDVTLWKESNELLKWSPAVLIFIAIFIIVRLFMEEQDKFKAQEALEEAENSAKIKNQPLFIKITRPFYKRYFLPLTQGKNKQNYRNKYRQKIANAGMTKEITPEEFMALKLFMILGGPFAFLAVRWIMEETWPLTITPVMGIVGYFYPDIWLAGLIKKRADDTLRAMPFIVDMLALSVEAGLDFMAAIQRVIEKAPPSPLVEEFETLIKETKIGSSRAEGLRQLGWRVNIIEINSFCATLIAADSVGASIGPILKQLSNELRVKRSSRAEQQGAQAATKILIPMIFFILPAVLVAIFAPMILKMMRGEM